MNTVELKDSIRWVLRKNANGKREAILQVLTINFSNFANGQGDVTQGWVDVPCVPEAKEPE